MAESLSEPTPDPATTGEKKTMKPRTLTILPLLALSGSAWAVAIGHHGGLILHCEPPLFFEESPA